MAGGPALPSLVEVGPVRYAVRVDDAELDRLSLEQECVLAGHTNCLEQQIVLRSNHGPDQLRVTLLHELLHAVMMASDLGDDPRRPDSQRSGEEDIVARLAPWLVLVLRANPDLVHFLIGGTP